jgi:streptogramin lyase
MHTPISRPRGQARILSWSFGAIAALLVAGTAGASTVSGTVRGPDGRPEANVFVTARTAARKMDVSVLTDSQGHYRIDELFAGEYTLRARKSGFGDSELMPLALDERDASADLKLKPDDDTHLSTPGTAWLGALPAGPTKAAFVTSCTICHDQASPFTHVQRDAEGWNGIIATMKSQADAYSLVLRMDPDQLAHWLADQKYGAHPAPYDPFAPAAHVATGARVTEYEVGDASSWEHDLAIEPKTGIAWVGDYVKDELVAVNPRTGEQTVYPVPVAHSGLHTLNFDRDGLLWMTFQAAAMVGSFDTGTKQWRFYHGFTPGSLNHSFAYDSHGLVRKDAKGRINIGLWGGNRTAVLDPATGKVTEYALPGPKTDMPYGIVVDSTGKIWYTKYAENKIGWFDPATGQGKDWELPKPDGGPHRMHIDDRDNLWIPLSGYGTLLRYNTRDGSQKEFPLPDTDSFPYDARYDAKSNRVWVTGNGGNALYAVDPDSGRATTFRMPSILSYGRVVSIDYSTGDVWTALCSYPNKLALRDYGVLVRIHHALDLAK